MITTLFKNVCGVEYILIDAVNKYVNTHLSGGTM